MTGPRIYFSYGMTKSGSTLAFELARAALIVAGHDQPRLSTAAVMDRKKLNFVSHLDKSNIEALLAETDAIGHMIAIKTHTRPDPGVVRLLQEGRAIAHAVYRDPRDMALSMVDHGRKSRAKGRPGFSEYYTPQDAMVDLRHQSNSLLAWLSLPGVRPLMYDDVAFNMETTTRRIIADLGLDVPASEVIHIATQERFTQRNKGQRARHENEMTPDLSAEFRATFAPMYDKLIDGRSALPADPPILNANEPLCLWPADQQETS